MGASALSDAFFTAWMFPNSLRKIFAEGALSAVFVPTAVQTIRSEGKQEIAGLMSLGFIVFEGIVLLICCGVMVWAPWWTSAIAPGFSPEQVAMGAHYLRILMPFIFLVSTCALLAGPLQAVGHFFVPAFGPVLLNAVYIIGLLIGLIYDISIGTLCYIIMAGGVLQLATHIYTYVRLGFGFGLFGKKEINKFFGVMLRFIPCFISMSVVEAGIIIDTRFASYLSEGTVSLVNYANRFMGIPLGVFAIALSTILLPHFSRISAYAPRRLGFYVLEATKLVWWVTIPVMAMMMLLSHKIFVTLFLSDKFTLVQADEAASILIASLIGLFFFAINKIIANVYYARHYTKAPALIAICTVSLNYMLNSLFIGSLGAVGLSLATSIAAIFQTVCLYLIIMHHMNLNVYFENLLLFAWRYLVQLGVIGALFLIIYNIIAMGLVYMQASYFLYDLGFWFWTAPLCLFFMLVLYLTKDWFGVRVIFMEGE